METETMDLKTGWPSIEFAYPLAVNSFEVMAKRFDSYDAKFQSVLTVGATATLGVVTLASARGVSLNSKWLLAVAALFFVSAALGVIGRMVGKLQVVDPQNLFDDYLAFSEFEFKKNLIHGAGVCFKSNARVLDLKQKYVLVVTALFLAQVACLALWALGLNW
jgi:hypothetical protein